MKKNYFKILLVVFVINLLSAPILFAQGAYLNINTGYAMSMGSQNINNFTNQTLTSSLYTSEQVNVSLGKGLNLGGAFGYMFNKNFGLELDVSYLIGGNSTATRNEEGTNYTNIYNHSLSSKMLRINPSLVINSGFEKINPYAKFGVIIGSGYIMDEYTIDRPDGFWINNYKLSGGTALGLSSVIGAMYNFSDKISIYGELKMINLSYSPTNGNRIKSSYNEIDLLPSLKTSEKEIEFVDNITKTYTNSNPSNNSNDLPKQELKYKYAFGSVGLNLGIRFSF